MQVCTGWGDAIRAAPELWPAEVLVAPPLEILTVVESPWGSGAVCRWNQRAHAQDMQNAQELLSSAAQLSPLTPRVRLEGFKEQVRCMCPDASKAEEATSTRTNCMLQCANWPAN